MNNNIEELLQKCIENNPELKDMIIQSSEKYKQYQKQYKKTEKYKQYNKQYQKQYQRLKRRMVIVGKI